MGVVFADSFQHYNNTAAKWTTAGGTFNANVANLRHLWVMRELQTFAWRKGAT
jgi:hypothetical protein